MNWRLRIERTARRNVRNDAALTREQRPRALAVARIGGEMGYWAASITRGVNIRGCSRRLDELSAELATLMREDECTEEQIAELTARLRSTDRRPAQ